MMKKALAMLGALLLMSAGCGRAVKSSSTKDGVTVELYGMKYEKKGIYTAKPEIRIINQCGEPITAVHYCSTFYDKDGTEMGEVRMFWRADESALADGASLDLNEGRYVIDYESDPASTQVEVTEVHRESEYPLDRIPAEGEYLYQAMPYQNLPNIKEKPPVKIECGIDNNGWLRKAIFEGEDLQPAIDAFVKIRLGSPNAPFVTDNYNYFMFCWEDGTAETIRVNLRYLEVPANGNYHSYYLEDDEDFWRLISEHLQETN